jgi:hypothetical protein
MSEYRKSEKDYFFMKKKMAIIDREYTERGPLVEIMGWYWRLAMGLAWFIDKLSGGVGSAEANQ